MDITNKVRDDPSFLESREYIDYVFESIRIDRIVFRMGPNCNLSCPHCYGGFSKRRIGLPDPKIVRSGIEQAIEDGFIDSVLTDGEPIRLENRQVLKLAAKYSGDLPVKIFTNSRFASSKEEAYDWIGYLKDNGFEMRQFGNSVHLSFGMTYNVDRRNYGNVMGAIRDAYGQFNLGMHFSLSGLTVDDPRENGLISYMADSLEDAFGIEHERSVKKDDSGRIMYVVLFPRQSFPVSIRWNDISAKGSALDMPHIRKIYHTVRFEPDDLGFNPKVARSRLHVDERGLVSWGATEECIRPARVYGDLHHDSLKEVKGRVLEDPVFLAFQLGGPRFLYSLARKIDPGYSVSGMSACDPCTSFFSDRRRVETVRDYIRASDLEKTYLSYAKRSNLASVVSR